MGGRSKQPPHGSGFLIDASVLIDFYNCDVLHLLKPFAEEFGTVYVGSHTLELDAEYVTGEDCRSAGIVVLAPRLEELEQAVFLSKESPRRVGYADSINIILASNRDFTLIAADKLMMEKARSKGVDTIRGLRILTMLVQRGRLEREQAIKIGRKVVDSNIRMPEKIFHDFVRDIED